MTKNPDYYDAANIALDGLAYQVIKDSQQALIRACWLSLMT